LTIGYLSVDEVLEIYGVIVRDFATSADPIAPAGVRDVGLLESAVYRQHTGFEGRIKYDTPLLSAASLVFGLCCDHPFFNGNKRAALISMLVHLDRNGYSMPGIGQSELFTTMMAIADHRLGVRDDHRSRKPLFTPTADEEVRAISGWLHRSAQKIVRGERVLSYRQLRRALSPFGLEIEVKGANNAELVRYVQRPATLFRKPRKERVKIADVGYRDEGTDVPKSEVKRIRELGGLTERQGVDSHSFYTTGLVVDDFVMRYRNVLQRLARR